MRAAEAGEAAPAATDDDDARILRRRAADAARKRHTRAAAKIRKCRRRRVVQAVTIVAALLALIILVSGVAAVAEWIEGRATTRTELTAAAHRRYDAAGRLGPAAQPVAFTSPPGAGSARNTGAGTDRLEAALTALSEMETRITAAASRLPPREASAVRPDDVAAAVTAQLLPEVTGQIDERLDELGQQLAGRLAAVTAEMRRGGRGRQQLAEAATPPVVAPLPLVPPRPGADAPSRPGADTSPRLGADTPPRPGAEAPQFWEVRAGQTLADVLHAWAQQARCQGQAGSGTWTVVYESPFAYPVAAGARLSATDFPGAVEQLISGFDAAVRADVYRGNCVVRVTAGGAG